MLHVVAKAMHDIAIANTLCCKAMHAFATATHFVVKLYMRLLLGQLDITKALEKPEY